MDFLTYTNHNYNILISRISVRDALSYRFTPDPNPSFLRLSSFRPKLHYSPPMSDNFYWLRCLKLVDSLSSPQPLPSSLPNKIDPFVASAPELATGIHLFQSHSAQHCIDCCSVFQANTKMTRFLCRCPLIPRLRTCSTFPKPQASAFLPLSFLRFQGLHPQVVMAIHRLRKILLP